MLPATPVLTTVPTTFRTPSRPSPSEFEIGILAIIGGIMFARQRKFFR
jgi:hypothetical protein